jgi:hypothetical protein
MALRLGKLCGNGPELWLRMQVEHDLWGARRRIADQLEQIFERSMPTTINLRLSELRERALREPAKQDGPAIVIMAVDAYNRNVEALAKAEDLFLGLATEKAVASSTRVGSEEFTAALKRFADATDDAEA